MTKRRHVLHVYKDYSPVLGGIENHVRLLANRLAGTGRYDVSVLVANTGPRTAIELDGDVRVVKAGRLRTVASTPLSLALFREMAKLRPDVVHLHFPYPVGELAYLACGHRAPMVLTYHSDIVRQRNLLRFYGPFLRRILARATRILVTSPHYLDSSPYLAPHRDRCRIVPFGVDLERFRPTPETLRRAAEIRSTPTPNTQHPIPSIVLFVGRLRYYKGLEYLIAAMREVEGRLVIVGDGPAGPDLRAQAAAEGLGERVVFVGEVPEADLPAYYHAADVFVLPSSHRSEAFGIVQLEAMATGLPIVCTELGTGTTFVTRNEETGLAVPPRDPAALTTALQRLIAEPELRKRLGSAGRARVAEHFSVGAMLRGVEQAYDDALRSSQVGEKASRGQG